MVTSRVKQALRLSVVGMGLLVSTEVLAFKEVAIPFKATPDRNIQRSMKGANEIRVLSHLGMQAVSFRADGSPALAWSTITRVPQKISKTTAEEQALQIARDLAPVL